MTFLDYLPGQWLPENDDRPIRPDLPWLRNLSWVKIHALQLGFAFGIISYWGILNEMNGVVIGLVVLIAEFMLGKVSSCKHQIGAHDIRLKPWYFVTAAFWTIAAIVVVFGFP